MVNGHHLNGKKSGEVIGVIYPKENEFLFNLIILLSNCTYVISAT